MQHRNEYTLKPSLSTSSNPQGIATHICRPEPRTRAHNMQMLTPLVMHATKTSTVVVPQSCNESTSKKAFFFSLGITPQILSRVLEQPCRRLATIGSRCFFLHRRWRPHITTPERLPLRRGISSRIPSSTCEHRVDLRSRRYRSLRASRQRTLQFRRLLRRRGNCLAMVILVAALWRLTILRLAIPHGA